MFEVFGLIQISKEMIAKPLSEIGFCEKTGRLQMGTMEKWQKFDIFLTGICFCLIPDNSENPGNGKSETNTATQPLVGGLSH
jgi:hypothetical protein